MVPSGFGGLLRAWRQSRRLSQEKLALSADVSPRHLSCIETGRASPSRDMVLLLASVLDVPFRDRNTLLAAAGFAPIYRETEYASPEMAPIRRAVGFILARHEPYGAIVVDSGWNLIEANQGAARLFATFVPAEEPSLVTNMARLLFHPQGMRDVIANWEEVARAMLIRTHLEAAAQGPDSPAARIYEELVAMPGVPTDIHRIEHGVPMSIVIPLYLERGGLAVKLFTTVTTLGTPADVTAQELRIETWFPADDASEAWFRDS